MHICHSAPVESTYGHPPGGFDTAVEDYQALLSLARSQGAVGGQNRGACKICGQLGHLTKQCRNHLSAHFEMPGATDTSGAAVSGRPAMPTLPTVGGDEEDLSSDLSDLESSSDSDSSSESEEERRKRKVGLSTMKCVAASFLGSVLFNYCSPWCLMHACTQDLMLTDAQAFGIASSAQCSPHKPLQTAFDSYFGAMVCSCMLRLC